MLGPGVEFNRFVALIYQGCVKLAEMGARPGRAGSPIPKWGKWTVYYLTWSGVGPGGAGGGLGAA
jgi:hypothetical protein